VIGRYRGAVVTRHVAVLLALTYNQPLPVKLNGYLFPAALASPSLWSQGKAVYGVGFCKGWPIAGAQGKKDCPAGSAGVWMAGHLRGGSFNRLVTLKYPLNHLRVTIHNHIAANFERLGEQTIFDRHWLR
jgi:hypothetical protein